MTEPAPATTSEFTCRSASSAAITGVLVALIAIETAALHLLLWRFLPWLAWGLTALSLWALWWILDDYRRMGIAAVKIDSTSIHFEVGRRLRATIPRTAIAQAISPSWRDLGAAAPPHLNATKPATPNVLLIFSAPQTVTILGAMRRPIDRLSLHLDAPEIFLRAVPAPEREHGRTD